MIIRWICKRCSKKWVYPVDRCIYCKGNTEKEIGKNAKVAGLTKIFIQSPEHPITPYYVLILEDEHSNKMPKKTMKEYKMGDEYRWQKSDDESAVSIIKIKYDFYEAIKHALTLIGDIKANKGTKVLIKPNIMIEAYPYLAMTTNPKVVKALIAYLFEKGVNKEDITIAEQSQFSQFEKAADKSGFEGLSKELGVKLVDLAKTEFVEKTSGGFKFKISKEIFDNDIMINVPVMKTHMLLGISGALENMIRVVSAENYKELEKDPIKALEAIAHLHKVLPKYITIGDASIGMQGNGPLIYGEPAFLNMLLASRDPVALDTVFKEIGLLGKVPLIEVAERLGIGSADLREITNVGDELDACRRELKPATGSRLIKLK